MGLTSIYPLKLILKLAVALKYTYTNEYLKENYWNRKRKREREGVCVLRSSRCVISYMFNALKTSAVFLYQLNLVISKGTPN